MLTDVVLLCRSVLACFFVDCCLLCLLLVVCCLFLLIDVCCLLFVVFVNDYCWQLVVLCLLRVVSCCLCRCCLLFCGCCLLLIVCCSLCVACCVFSVGCCCLRQFAVSYSFLFCVLFGVGRCLLCLVWYDVRCVAAVCYSWVVVCCAVRGLMAVACYKVCCLLFVDC